MDLLGRLTVRVILAGILCALFFMPALPVRAQTPQQSDFYTRGLSTTPNESAEEILMRAHRGDTFAMALVVVGYDFGVNGFPADRRLALTWTEIPSGWGAPDMADFLHVYWSRHIKLDDEYEKIRTLLEGAFGRQSPLAALFKKTGIFNLEDRLAEIDLKKTPLSPKGKETYESEMEARKKQATATLENIAQFRTAAKGPLSMEQEKALNYDVAYGDVRQLLFFAGTTHNPETENPDWKPERLLSFLDQRVKMGGTGNAATVSRMIETWLAFDSDPVSAIIRRAHDGDITAVRTLAGHYASGEMGFIKNPALAFAWFERGAFMGDAICLAACATDTFRYEHYLQSFIWATLAIETGDARVQDMTRWIQQNIEARVSSSDLEKARAKIPEYREFIRRTGSGTKAQKDISFNETWPLFFSQSVPVPDEWAEFDPGRPLRGGTFKPPPRAVADDFSQAGTAS